MIVIRRPRYGFTLLELLFVVVISAILVSAAVPKLKNSLGSLALQNFLSDIGAFSRYAQMKAINSGSLNRVVFDRSKRMMYLENRVIVLDSSGTQVEQWKTERARRIPENVAIDSIENGISMMFYPDGTSNEASFQVRGGVSSVFSVETGASNGSVIVKQEQ